MAVLPTPGFSDEDRIVLGPPAENLKHALDFVGAADDRIQLTFLGHLGQIPSEFIECRGVALPVSLAWRRLSQEGDGQLSGRQQIGAEATENLSADPLLFTQEAEQEMLAADMVMAQAVGPLRPRIRSLS